MSLTDFLRNSDVGNVMKEDETAMQLAGRALRGIGSGIKQYGMDANAAIMGGIKTNVLDPLYRGAVSDATDLMHGIAGTNPATLKQIREAQSAQHQGIAAPANVTKPVPRETKMDNTGQPEVGVEEFAGPPRSAMNPPPRVSQTGYAGIQQISGLDQSEYGKAAYKGIGDPNGSPGRTYDPVAQLEALEAKQKRARLERAANNLPSMSMGLNQFFQTAARRNAARDELEGLRESDVASADRAQEAWIEQVKLKQKQQEINQGRYQHASLKEYNDAGLPEGERMVLLDTRTGQQLNPAGIGEAAAQQIQSPEQAYTLAMQEAEQVGGGIAGGLTDQKAMYGGLGKDQFVVQRALQNLGVTEFIELNGQITGRVNGQWMTFQNGKLVPINGK